MGGPAMNLDSALLDAQLARTDIAAMSDADAVIAMGPVYTPSTTRITLTSLGAAWGAARAAAVYRTLRTIGASVDPSADLCSLVADILAGPGFDTANPNSQTTIADLVTADICTADEARDATNTVSYPAGAQPTLEEVQAGRARLAQRSAITALIDRFTSLAGYAANERLQPLLTQIASGQTVAVPTYDSLLTDFAAQGAE